MKDAEKAAAKAVKEAKKAAAFGMNGCECGHGHGHGHGHAKKNGQAGQEPDSASSREEDDDPETLREQQDEWDQIGSNQSNLPVPENHPKPIPVLCQIPHQAQQPSLPSGVQVDKPIQSLLQGEPDEAVPNGNTPSKAVNPRQNPQCTKGPN